MQAIILAAGMGRRLGEFTADNTKCMVEVNGVRLIDRMLQQLFRHNVKKIILVIGYKGDNLKKYIKENYPGSDITFVENSIYDKTNNIYSLWLAKDHLIADETLLLESDLIFEDSILKFAIDSEYENCALISKYEAWMDGTMVRINDENNIVNFIPKKAFKYSDVAHYYKTVNIYKFSVEFSATQYLPFLDAYMKVLGNNEYYEQVLRVLTLIDGDNLKALQVNGKKWYEIDDVQDLRIAEAIFADDEVRLAKLQKCYGGYWRYPSLVDFCYLVNPYFPKSRLIDEMKANFETLLREYPSGMGVNSMLAGKYFGIKDEFIVVGNGAAEIIKSITTIIPGKIGIVFPTFEEYPNRKNEEDIIKYIPNNKNFSYSADNVIEFFNDKDVSSLLLINPDNPSGNFIKKNDLDKIITWSEKRQIKIIIDESFVDFTDNFTENTLLKNEILQKHLNLIVVKSISKSYGVPGLRLGVAASSNIAFIKKIKKDVAIWNINSFAEFYMQIFGKYEKDYIDSCLKFVEERKRFYEQLSQISYLRVVPSQANYFLCEITKDYTSTELTKILLNKHNILIKDCCHKKGFENKGQYIRIAIRDAKDNDTLVKSLQTLSK